MTVFKSTFTLAVIASLSFFHPTEAAAGNCDDYLSDAQEHADAADFIESQGGDATYARLQAFNAWQTYQACLRADL